VDDVRESPAIKIIEIAKGYGSDVHTFDPHILGRSTEKSLEEILEKSQAWSWWLITTSFKSIEPKFGKKYGIKVIIDGKNCLDKDKSENWELFTKASAGRPRTTIPINKYTENNTQYHKFKLWYGVERKP